MTIRRHQRQVKRHRIRIGWRDLPSILLAIALAFVFGYALTIRPLLASGMAFRTATRLAFAADTLSITIMEIVDNLIILAIPAAMAAGLTANRWLIQRGRGHAVLHEHHR